MYLKRIEINGFKSFANKTELLINNKITGIVGPNGSGKSNIADAIRWVLGEQSSKNLRGAKMEDVIFNGTQNRPKKAFCQVSLIFDNQDMRLPSEYTEIVISRKMFRSGESEYRINDNLVRLKDILDLIRDTGIGKEGYSIIGQGRIDEILASKPTARRKVFEEAAGIMKFRIRKEEAERKLERTEENLMRVEDILEELKDQLEPLEEQAARTRSYLTLFDRQRVLDASIYVYHYDRAQARTQKLEGELATIDQELEAAQQEFAGAGQEADVLSSQLEALEEAGEVLSQEVRDLARELERLRGEDKVSRERIKNTQGEAERLAQELENAQSQLTSTQEEWESFEKKKQEIERRLQGKQEELNVLLAGREDLEQRLGAKRERESILKEQQLALLDEVSQAKSRQSGLLAQTEGYETRRKELEERIAGREQDLLDKQEVLKREQARLEELKQNSAHLASQINQSNQALAQGKEKKAQLFKELEDANRAFSEAASKKKLMEDLKAEYEGYSDSVRKLMTGAKAEPDLKGKLLGTFAELIKAPAEYETAIEMLLGGALQNVVVEDEYDAKAAIEYLRRRKLGRVTFLPLEALRVNYLTDEERKLLTMPGVKAVASEALSFDPKVAPAVEFLLARTVIVDTMDNAIALMRQADYSFRAVTLKGDVIRPGGSMSGGSAGGRQYGLLSRERLIQQMEEEIKKAAAQREDIQAALAAADIEAAAAKEQAGELMAELKQSEIAAAAQRGKITSQEALLQSTHAAGVVLKSQLALLEQEASSLVETKETLEKEIAEKSQALEEVQAELAALSGQEELAQELQRQAEEISACRIASAELLKEKEGLEGNLARLEESLKKLKASSVSTGDQAALLNRQRQELEEQLESLADKSKEEERKLEEGQEALLENQAKRQALREQVQEKQKRNAAYQQQQAALLERKYKAEGQLEKMRLSLENMGERLWEDYELTYAEAQTLKIDQPSGECMKEVQEVRGRIRELGVINPNAIEDYDRVRERTDELTLQKEDLVKAEADLRQVIEELMSSMRTTFKEKFQKINENFQSIFKELFGGGKAELSLEEGDIMESGIEIVAEPPGKKLQHISLLSGGERALTAIALLFAMIRINPSPVCLLDEIDAPLDEANAVRFGEYLRRIETTQFLVITHRKPTMLVCQSLYGVAMEEKGVSKMVSVKIS